MENIELSTTDTGKLESLGYRLMLQRDDCVQKLNMINAELQQRFKKNNEQQTAAPVAEVPDKVGG